MKPILFPSDATTFTTNGLGSLDPTSCVVTEERNGQYELECVVPVESPHFDEIHNNMILVVIPGDGGSLHAVSQRQAFRIYHVTEPLNGMVTLNARHLSYDLSYNTVMQCNASTITTAFSAIVANMVETNRFTFDTDKSTSANFKVTVPQTVRQLLGGQSGSILDVYGGEYQWDNWRVCLWNQRGSDTDVTLRYGKNITDLSQEENLENVVTGIVPYWADEETVLTLQEKSVDSAYASQYPYKRTVPVDFSSNWEEQPTVAQLRSRAQSYVASNRIGIPKVSIKVSFVALWQTDEYKEIAPLERVHLCDTVGVVFEKYGINTRAEVIKTEWDCLAERYLSIELGEPRSNFAQTIVEMNDETTQEIVEAKSEMQKAIDAATAAITGVNGGYLKINSTSDGKPYELLIMDHETEAQAVVIWRYNLAGWGVSTDGGRTYSMAATLNSTYGASINANYIVAGTMLANRIHGGTLKLGGTNNGNGVFEIYNSSGTKILTIDKDGINYGNNKFKVDALGNMTAQNANLTSATVTGSITSVNGGNTAGINDGKVYSQYNGQKISLYNAGEAIYNETAERNVFSLFADNSIGELVFTNSQGNLTIYAGGSHYINSDLDFGISTSESISLNADDTLNLSAGSFQHNGSVLPSGGFYDGNGNYISVEDGFIVGGI